MGIIKLLAEELGLKVGQVKRTVNLLDDGNTIPFIARYRKEMTGKLDEKQIRELEERLNYLRKLRDKKETVINKIDEQDKLTKELEAEIKKATKLQEVKDLYRPYKQKRKTRAGKARAKGLEPLAETFMEQDITDGSIKGLAKEYLNEEEDLAEIEDVLQGVRDIIAEDIADQPKSRKYAREITFKQGNIVSEGKEDEVSDYEMYYDYTEKITKIPHHGVLAINRGESEEILKVKVDTNDEKIISWLKESFIVGESLFKEEIEMAIEDGYQRLIAPAIEREVRSKLTDQAEEHAIDVFAENLRNLLLQPPVSDVRVLAIDPAFRTGCKLAAIDELGKFLGHETIYPHAPQNKSAQAKKAVKEFIKEYKIDVIAIGNGTACRETETLVAEIISELEVELSYVIVNEAGASVYSASEVGAKEFPELDLSLRGAVSIGRRLQDPLAELVKINPRHIGVGMYQHDINQGRLDESLTDVVESVVNYVGVDLNSASASLLQYVSGINSRNASSIVKHREQEDKFKNRKELKDVYGVGPKTFKQAAGFLKIREGENPLDQTPIHPESYSVTKKILEIIDFELSDLKEEEKLEELTEEIKNIDLITIKDKIEDVGLPTLKDIKQALLKPGRDPRQKLSGPTFRSDVLKLEDLKPEMILDGTVRNVVDFGAFVDIGVKEDGLVHISELSSEFVKDPMKVVSIGDQIKVKVLEVDQARGRISLTMNF